MKTHYSLEYARLVRGNFLWSRPFGFDALCGSGYLPTRFFTADKKKVTCKKCIKCLEARAK